MDLATPMTATPALAFDELLLRHRGIVHKVAAGYARGAEDRADLAQEIAMQLWRAWPSYDPARSFSTWMYRIALNVAISFFRAESRKARTFVPAEEQVLETAMAPAESAAIEEDLRMLWRAIDGLDALDRALVVLYLDGQSYEAIAEVLGISQTNVGTKINRIKTRLRRDLSRAV